MKMRLALSVLSLLLISIQCGCTRQHLTVQSQYVGLETLASYHVNTPDPHLNHPPLGEQLILSWSLPSEWMDYHDLHLQLHVRYRNHEECIEKIPLKENTGYTTFGIFNDAYIQKRGFQTYKVDLIGDCRCLDSWYHQLWYD